MISQALFGALFHHFLFFRRECERKVGCGAGAGVDAQPVGGIELQLAPLHGVGNKSCARHVQGERAGIDAGCLAADLTAVDQGDPHATARKM